LKYDLHSHTTCSDGRLTPQALLDRAVDNDVGVLAITDHDTVKAINIAKQYIDDKQLDMTLISGVEISTSWANHEIHIVGLCVDANDSQLIERLAGQINYRNERAQLIGERLERAGIPQAYENAKRIAADAAVSRSHYAKYLIELGKAKDFGGVFKKYMKRGKPGYVSSQWIDPKTAIQWIHDAGGIAVLAHPSRYDLSAKWLKRLLADFKRFGGDAMEVALSQQSPQERALLGQYAKDYELLASVGSDFHFPTNWCELGKNLYLSDKYLPVWHNWQI
jgi:hypothetical protein